MTDRKHRVRELVREFLADDALRQAIEEGRTPRCGSCPACGHVGSELVIRDAAGVRAVAIGEAEDIARASEELVAQCRPCGAALRWRGGWLWTKDESTLRRGQIAALAAMRRDFPLPPLPTCPHCGTRCRTQLGQKELAGTRIGRYLLSLPVSFCTRCGGAFRIGEGHNLLPVFELLDERQEYVSDFFRAYGIAKALLESGKPGRIERARAGRWAQA